MKPRVRRVRLTDDPPQWSEALIGRALANSLFQSRSVLVVPNCNWTGNECDLLVIEPGLRIIDVEIKISRADLRADMKKDKWWKHRPWSRSRRTVEERKIPREWPDKVWKHYYALPRSIWTEQLLESIPAASGVLLLNDDCRTLSVMRRAKPNKDAKPVTAADAIDIARLASLRMWSALTKGEQR